MPIGFRAVCPQLVGLGGGGGGTGVAFSDDFNRADSDSLGANWTEINGDIDINSNEIRGTRTGDYDLAVWNTIVGSSTQYVKFTPQSGIAGGIYYWVFRYTDSTTPYYVVEIGAQTGNTVWASQSGDGSDWTVIQSGGALSDWTAFGQPIGMTIEGTGTSTVVRIWANCSGLPSAANNWNGDATPSMTLTNDPGTAANTGNKVGCGFYSGQNALRIDDFFGGSL